MLHHHVSAGAGGRKTNLLLPTLCFQKKFEVTNGELAGLNPVKNRTDNPACDKNSITLYFRMIYLSGNPKSTIFTKHTTYTYSHEKTDRQTFIPKKNRSRQCNRRSITNKHATAGGHCQAIGRKE
jgi:hypothetical protein